MPGVETAGPAIAVLGVAIIVAAFGHSIVSRRGGRRRWPRLGEGRYETLEMIGFVVMLAGLAMSGHDIWTK